MITDKEVMELFRETKALLKGHFLLRSGLHSDEYFQCALLLQYPLLAEKLCRSLVEKAHGILRLDGIDGVISPALGGIPVGHEVARALGVRSIFAEKEEGRLVLRRGFHVGPGERFVVAEDVVTRGGRVQEVMDIVTSRGGTVVAVLVLVNRSGGRATFGDIPLVSLLEWEPMTWAPAECPLCQQGIPLEKPGSK